MKPFLVLAALAVAIPATASDMLPFNDGLYASDARLCSMSIQDMFEAYGDGVGVHTRTIDGTTFSHNYESGCETTEVVVDGSTATATMTCSGEGDEWQDVAEFGIVGKNAFSHMNLDFVRCDSAAAADPQVPATIDLIADWQEANGTCRGSSDASASDTACGKRDVLDEMLAARGWCYSQEHWAGYQNMWHVCVDALKTNY